MESKEFGEYSDQIILDPEEVARKLERILRAIPILPVTLANCDICGRAFAPEPGQVIMFCSDACYDVDCNRMADAHYASVA